jgi:hypothetical protein
MKICRFFGCFHVFLESFRELSIKEEKVLQKQGEKTSTVERVRAMQDEIQSLK